MGLLDQLAGASGDGIGGQLLKQLGGSAQGPLVQTVLGLLQQPGGLQGLLDKFQQAGLGIQVASWVGTGANQPVDGVQVEQALGADWIGTLAAQLGTTPAQASQSVAGTLPELVNQLTPNGQVRDAQSLLAGGLDGLDGLGGPGGLLKGKLFG